jgi:hypothetical protein
VPSPYSAAAFLFASAAASSPSLVESLDDPQPANKSMAAAESARTVRHVAIVTPSLPRIHEFESSRLVAGIENRQISYTPQTSPRFACRSGIRPVRRRRFR